jgi:hypothetical protein
MRPRKRILLIDPDEYRQSITRLVLHTVGYHPLSASSIYSAAQVAHDDAFGPDVLLGYAPLDEAYLLDLAHDLDRPALFVSKVKGDKGKEYWPSTEYVLGQIKVKAARKPGPKPMRREAA